LLHGRPLLVTPPQLGFVPAAHESPPPAPAFTAGKSHQARLGSGCGVGSTVAGADAAAAVSAMAVNCTFHAAALSAHVACGWRIRVRVERHRRGAYGGRDPASA